MQLHDVLIRPVITEKSTMLMEEGKYTFRVPLTANKVQTFSIHCWSDEIDEINHALLYGSIQDSDWAYGAIISGKITPGIIDFILSYESAPCSKTGTYEKMTPFFMWSWNHISSVLIMEEKSQSNIWISEKEIPAISMPMTNSDNGVAILPTYWKDVSRKSGSLIFARTKARPIRKPMRGGEKTFLIVLAENRGIFPFPP